LLAGGRPQAAQIYWAPIPVEHQATDKGITKRGCRHHCGGDQVYISCSLQQQKSNSHITMSGREGGRGKGGGKYQVVSSREEKGTTPKQEQQNSKTGSIIVSALSFFHAAKHSLATAFISSGV
jgi:hypothetical protein